jgi:hypothetical protein
MEPPEGNGAPVPANPVRDHLVTKTQSDAVRHGIARLALLKRLLGDERVVTLFRYWRESSGLGDMASTVADELDHLAQAAGLQHRSQLFEAMDGREGGEPSPLLAVVSDSLQRLPTACLRL